MPDYAGAWSPERGQAIDIQAGQAEDGSRPKFVTEEVGVGGWWWHLLVRAEDAARTPVQSEPFRWRCTRPIPSPPARRRRPKTGEWAGL